MEQVNSYVKEAGKKFSEAFSHVAQAGAERTIEYTIDCSDLDEKYHTHDIRHAEKFRKMFSELQVEEVENKPCLYYFEVLSDVSAELLVEKIRTYAATTAKATPKENSYSKDSKILYVGKVEARAWGRLIAHLGFHTNKNNGNPQPSKMHGLQLFYWAKELSLKLKFTVLVFNNDMKGLVEVLEKQLAGQLNPIIGKH